MFGQVRVLTRAQPQFRQFDLCWRHHKSHRWFSFRFFTVIVATHSHIHCSLDSRFIILICFANRMNNVVVSTCVCWESSAYYRVGNLCTRGEPLLSRIAIITMVSRSGIILKHNCIAQWLYWPYANQQSNTECDQVLRATNTWLMMWRAQRVSLLTTSH